LDQLRINYGSAGDRRFSGSKEPVRHHNVLPVPLGGRAAHNPNWLGGSTKAV